MHPRLGELHQPGCRRLTQSALEHGRKVLVLRERRAVVVVHRRGPAVGHAVVVAVHRLRIGYVARAELARGDAEEVGVMVDEAGTGPGHM